MMEEEEGTARGAGGPYTVWSPNDGMPTHLVQEGEEVTVETLLLAEPCYRLCSRVQKLSRAGLGWGWATHGPPEVSGLQIPPTP